MSAFVMAAIVPVGGVTRLTGLSQPNGRCVTSKKHKPASQVSRKYGKPRNPTGKGGFTEHPENRNNDGTLVSDARRLREFLQKLGAEAVPAGINGETYDEHYWRCVRQGRAAVVEEIANGQANLATVQLFKALSDEWNERAYGKAVAVELSGPGGAPITVAEVLYGQRAGK